MIQDAIAILVAGEEPLTDEQAGEVAREILDGKATSSQIAAFITGLRIRGETPGHVRAFTAELRARAARIRAPEGLVLDTCGTGGDASGTFNVSTTAALIAAAAGVTVAKHGNRAVSSKCGSADVLKQLGVDIEIPLDRVEQCLAQVGIAFLFAPSCHSAMRHAAEARRDTAIRSIFNMIGPLSNPAGATHQLIGVYDPELTEMFAHVLKELGTVRALIVHGSDGIDEVTTTSVTQVTELHEGDIETWTLDPGDFGLHPANVEDLVVEDAEASASEIRRILAGGDGPCTDMALANAGAALYVAGQVASIPDGFQLARQTIAEGKAAEKLDALIAFTNAKA